MTEKFLSPPARMNFRNPRIGRIFFGSLFILSVFLLSSCVSRLWEAKHHFARGESFSREYKTGEAEASYKRALEEASRETRRRPSSQAYMVKGMAELALGKWSEAEESFLSAYSLGFEPGQEWAEQLSLLGLASSLEKMGLTDTALRAYTQLLEKSRLRPVLLPASGKYVDLSLKRAGRLGEKEKRKALLEALRTVEKLTVRDFGCGFYHYLQSQVLGHLSDYRRSFEEAAIARELKLPSEEIFRDNDLQIVFCHQKLKEVLAGEEWEEFRSLYLKWTGKWGWEDEATPGWKKKR